MKIIKALFIIACIFSMSSVNSQNQDQTEKKDNKVRLFTMEEYSNLHLWVDKTIQEIGMSNELKEKYETLFTFHLDKIGRLEENETELTAYEYLKGMKLQISKLNSSVAPLLSSDQNKKHLDLMMDFERILTNKLALKKS